jgi:ABC-type branched-subunit amino acid transport system substrate-binding protein
MSQVNDRLRVGACLSLSGRFARFGRQAALGLQAWQVLDGAADLIIEDDHSDRHTLEALLPGVAERCDVLLGPYSTVLMRAAGRIASESGWLVWNHGGSGDDVEQTHPGHVVSVLTPASRYAEPFVQHLAASDEVSDALCVVHGPGKFGRQVADGAAMTAEASGLMPVRAEPGSFPPAGLPLRWDLFSAGVFEQDAELVRTAIGLADPPQRVCAIAAGVHDFAGAVDDPDGVFGIAQWFPGGNHHVQLGPGVEAFLRVHHRLGGSAADYPAAQAAAGAVLAAHCARAAGSTRREDLWTIAASLDTSTLFGQFKIDPHTGTQINHQTVLIRWKDSEPVRVSDPVNR